MTNIIIQANEFISFKSQKWIILIIGFVIFMLIMVLSTNSKDNIQSERTFSIRKSANENFQYLKTQQITNEPCHWDFLNYTPSSWENTWYSNIELFQENVCERLSNVENVDKTVLWMQRMVELQKFGRMQKDDGKSPNDHLFSRMFYRQRCHDNRTNSFVDVAEVSHLIEPLVGLLRDPFTVCQQLSSSQVPESLYNGAILLSRRFILLSIAAPFYLSSFVDQNSFNLINNFNSNVLPWMYARSKIDEEFNKYPKQIILFDLGSNYFGDSTVDVSDTSTRWFYEHYKRFNLKFDRIIAYEERKLDPKIAWEQLPDDVFPAYTLINTGCTENGTFNPWKMLRQLAKPNDYVVVKVDIDTFDLEYSLVNQIINDSNIYSLIDELFFEHHVSVKEMLAYWRPPPGKLSDSYTMFTKLRKLGIRMHSWP